MLSCVIVDDETASINVLKRFISKVPDLKLLGTSTDPQQGLQMITDHKPDLAFLDIQMPNMSGMELASQIQWDTKFIFCTAHSEFAVQSYELEAVDYLMKPIEFGRFLKAIHRLSNTLHYAAPFQSKPVPNDYIYVNTGRKGSMIKIDFDDIQHIEGMNNYVCFHLSNDKKLAYLTLQSLEDRLPGEEFIRVHKSYIVPLSKVKALENNELHMKNSTEKVPVGPSYKEALIKKLRNKLM